MDPTEKIPSDLVVKSAINITYRIGISPLKNGDSVNETKSHYVLRLSIGFAYIMLILRCAIFLLLYLNEDESLNERIFIYLGDFAYFFPAIRVHWNMLLVSAFTFCFIIHLLHFKIAFFEAAIAFTKRLLGIGVKKARDLGGCEQNVT